MYNIVMILTMKTVYSKTVRSRGTSMKDVALFLFPPFQQAVASRFAIPIANKGCDRIVSSVAMACIT